MQVKPTWSHHWIFLMFSILGEVIGTSIMKISHDWTFSFGSETGLIIMWVCLGFSYYCLAKATTVIPIGVAFALWDAIGLVLIVGFSFFFLDEVLTMQKSIGLVCVLMGGFLVHHGTSSHSVNKA